MLSSQVVPKEQKPVVMPCLHVLAQEKTSPNGCQSLLLLAASAAQPHAPCGLGLGLPVPAQDVVCAGGTRMWAAPKATRPVMPTRAGV